MVKKIFPIEKNNWKISNDNIDNNRRVMIKGIVPPSGPSRRGHGSSPPHATKLSSIN